MLEFLKEVNIDEDVISDLEQTYSEANLCTLNSHEFEVIKIIKYFKELGIEYIDELLVNNLEIFFCRFDEIVKKFSGYNITDLVEEVNYDYMQINKYIFD